MIPNYYMYGDFFDFEGLIFKTGKRVTLEKHSPIKQFNEPADKFYYVRSGLVRAVVLHSDGNEKALYVAGSGCLLPQFSPHGMPKWEENLLMEAYTDVEAILLTRSELEELAGRNYPLMEKMLDVAVCLQHSLTAQMLSQMYDDGMVRVCQLLYFHIANRHIKHTHPVKCVKISQQDIAMLTGLNRVNANKVLQQLKKEEAIDIQRKRIKILDVERIMEHCNGDVNMGEW